MFEIITEMGEALIISIIQLIAGCIIALLIYNLLKDKIKTTEVSFLKNISLAAVLTIAGMALPLGAFGIIPVMAALILAGLKTSAVLPMFVSNAIFNILTCFNDISFVWRTGYKRVILAFVIGLVFAFILLASKKSIILNNFPKLENSKFNLKNILNIIGETINKLGIFILAGVVADILFSTYVLPGIINAIFKGVSFIPKYFGSLNVVNPFFLLAITLIKAILDMTRLSALISFLKPKGLIIYYASLAGCTILLAASAFTNI